MRDANPAALVLAGNVVAHALLEPGAEVKSLRGRLLQVFSHPAVVTYPPYWPRIAAPTSFPSSSEKDSTDQKEDASVVVSRMRLGYGLLSLHVNPIGKYRGRYLFAGCSRTLGKRISCDPCDLRSHWEDAREPGEAFLATAGLQRSSWSIAARSLPLQLLQGLDIVPGDRGAFDRRGPAGGVHDHAADLRILVGRIRLVARAEVKDLALAPVVAAAAAKDFAAGEPADKDEGIRLGMSKYSPYISSCAARLSRRCPPRSGAPG